MTRHLAFVLIAVALLVAAFVLWQAAARTRDAALAAERRMTLQERSDYWSGKYDSVMQAASADAANSLLVAANASFRKAMRDTNGTPSVERLDQVVQGYSSALKNSGFSSEAAFNFEYVSRLRDAAAVMARRTARTGAATGSRPPDDDLPAGQTLHGRPGTHPPSTNGQEFEVLTPMDYREREAQPQPTPGRPFPRKG
jgi:hypothetical protein